MFGVGLRTIPQYIYAVCMSSDPQAVTRTTYILYVSTAVTLFRFATSSVFVLVRLYTFHLHLTPGLFRSFMFIRPHCHWVSPSDSEIKQRWPTVDRTFAKGQPSPVWIPFSAPCTSWLPVINSPFLKSTSILQVAGARRYHPESIHWHKA